MKIRNTYIRILNTQEIYEKNQRDSLWKHTTGQPTAQDIANQLAQTIAAAESGHAILAEAMTIYHMPLYKKLHEIAVSGELGPLRMIQMNFGSYKEYDMATITLSLHAKQPKRGLVIFEKGYIEVYEYPRAEKAVITYTESGKKKTIETGKYRRCASL